MKRLLLFLLTVILVVVCAGTTGAEGGSSLRDIPGKQIGIHYSTVIDPEAYPRVALTEYSPSEILTGKNEAVFWTFDLPANAYPVTFASNVVSCIIPGSDGSDYTRVSYSLTRKTKEEFLSDDSAKMILFDRENSAAYQGSGKCCGYILLPEAENMSLMVEIQGLDFHDMFEDEMARLLANSIEKVTEPSYWSQGLFSGANMVDDIDTDYMLRIDFPSLPDLGGQGDDPHFIVVNYSSGNILNGYYQLADKKLIEIEYSLVNSDSFSYKRRDSYKAQSGDVWKYLADQFSGSDVCWSVFAAKALPDDSRGYKKFLSVRMTYYSPDNKSGWTKEAIDQVLEVIDSQCAVMSFSDDPYTPPAP